MRFIVILLLFSVVLGYELEQNMEVSDTLPPIPLNSIIENKILKSIEKFRANMKEQNLEPLVLDEFKLHSDNVPKMKLMIKNTKISLLSTFKVNKLKARMIDLIPLKYKIDFDVGILVVNMDIDYYCFNGTIVDNIFSGEGDANFSALEMKLIGSVEVSVLKMFFDKANVVFSLKGFKSNVNGIENINQTIEEFVTKLVKEYENEISKLLNEMLPEILNKYA